MTHRRWIPAALVLLSLSACASGAPSPETPAPAEAAAPGPTPPAEPVVDPELVAAERVTEIRLNQDPVVLTVGGSFALQELEPDLLDEDGAVVEDVPLMWAPPDGPIAAMQDGRVVGLREGETELALAVMVADRRGEPEPRMFSKRLVVQGAPIASIEIIPSELGIYSGTAVPFRMEARSADGTVRSRYTATWTSRNPEIASVSEGGFVRGHRTGSATIVASAEGVESAHVVEVLENPVRAVEISPGSATVRAGDVVRFEALATDAAGERVTDVGVTYSVAGDQMRGGLGASVYPDGAFVAEAPGVYRVIASAGPASTEVIVEAREREVVEDPVRVGTGLISNAPTSDLWVFRGLDGRDYAYHGTHSGGQKMFAWDVTDPASPILTDSVVVDARVVNDVKVNEAATIAIITREGASDRRNGMVLLDIADPAHPQIITTYTENLTGGVHNVFFVGDLVYAISDGTLDVHIVDISDPTAPREVGRWGLENPDKYLHDIWVVDGIGYVSYWNDGVYVVDLGDGRWGGTPTDPVVISSYAYPEGNTHVAFPYTNSDGNAYLFVGDEIFGCEECTSRTTGSGPRGFIHVLSMEDPENPVEVGRYEVPEAGAHNIWVEDDRLYAAYYEGGLRVVDVSGDLRGDLYRQGREIAWFPTGHPDGYEANHPMAWGPQPYNGNVFVSDMHSGLWVVRLEPRPGAPLLP